MKTVMPGLEWLAILMCCLSLAAPAVAGRDLQDAVFSTGEQDRAFEVEVYQLLQQQLGREAVRYVRITRFGNTLLLTGVVADASLRDRVDALVLEAAGIRREAPAATGVVPAHTRDCGGKPVIGNARRRQIVSSDKDCSALRTAPGAEATGQMFNHIDLASPEPARDTAAADVVAARARLALVEAGHAEALDPDAMRLAAQGGVLFVLLRDGMPETVIQDILLKIPGVKSVRFHTG